MSVLRFVGMVSYIICNVMMEIRSAGTDVPLTV